MTPPIAYLAQGRLYWKPQEGPPKPIESRFGQTITQRILEIDQRHSWKARGRGAQFMSRGLLWPGAEGEPGRVGVRITSLSPGREPGELLYALETQEIVGILAVRAEGREEQRLFHGNERRVRHLSALPGHDKMACSVGHDSGAAGIALMEADGSNLSEVTEGDAVDEAPSFVPGSPTRLVYQSAGIGRDRDGRFAGLGPSAAKRLDLGSGEIVTLLEDPSHDFLGPRVDAGGRLHCIRRPHRGAARGTLWRATLDFLLFPFRIGSALFQWLNFFTVRYSGKPLTTAGGPKRQGADLRQMMIWGNLIDAEGAARESRLRGDDTPDLVPPSWQLVRQDPDGGTEILAKGVLSFDIADDGSLIYTNGSAVYSLSPDGRRERLAVEAGIEQVVALG